MTKLGRNDPCFCGSGKKFKSCCIDKPRHRPPTPAQPLARKDLLLLADRHFRSGQYDQAEQLVKQMLKLTPNDAALLHMHGQVCDRLGRHAQALGLVRQALARDARNPIFHFSLGTLLANAGDIDGAIAAYRGALALKPRWPEASFNLANALHAQHREDEAIAAYREAVAQAPELVPAQVNLANALLLRGDVDAALACMDEAVARRPDMPAVASARLMTTLYCPRFTAEEIFARHRDYWQAFTPPATQVRRNHPNPRTSDRRLRIAYVSADFRQHAVAFFIEPVLARHDKSRFEVFAYYNHAVQDAATERIRALVEHWIPCVDWTDEALAEHVHRHQIDILVDLGGHTTGHRLLAFARKPAPVQVTWIGYPGTTGLPAMDYRLTDALLDPPGQSDRCHTETLVRLPTMAPFQGAAQSPAVSPLPAMSGAPFTLACLNKLAKINPEVVALWSRILKALPRSRLVVGPADDAGAQAWLRELFAAQGIGAERLDLLPSQGMRGFLETHGRIDLSLDPFPWNGGTTTMHSLWMGVPVVTLPGDRTASRLGASSLAAASLPQTIARDPDDYVDIAVRAAADLPALAEVRATLRERLAGAGPAAPEPFTRALEQAFLAMWARWCESP